MMTEKNCQVGFKPGTRSWFERYGEGYGETFNEADAEGLMILTVKGRHVIQGYTERTFYVRTWEYPGGLVCGDKSLLMITSTGFDKLTKGFRYDYEMNENFIENITCLTDF